MEGSFSREAEVAICRLPAVCWLRTSSPLRGLFWNLNHEKQLGYTSFSISQQVFVHQKSSEGNHLLWNKGFPGQIIP
ncbi:hypothetical protein CapIbe_020835 [Capra ibex]